MNSNNNSSLWTSISWLIGLLFMALGVLNVIYVHFVPGMIYMLIAMFYIPPYAAFLKRKHNFTIAVWLKIVIAIAIIWFTLGVSDLFELFEAWILK